MSKILSLPFVLTCLCLPCYVFCQEWKTECVGYYQVQLPDELEMALYPVKGFVNPAMRPETNGFFTTNKYAPNGITFGEEYDNTKKDTVQSQFSSFYYSDYELDISSENETRIDFLAYKEMVIDNIDFLIEVARQYEERDLKILGKPLSPEKEFGRRHNYLIREYPNSFVNYDYRGYTIYITNGNRLYHFWGGNEKDTGEKSQTAEAQVQKSEPEVLSLLKRFRARKLYEVPTEQGFCLPYGFIARDSGHEPHNMGVTYRLKNHPDVTIFFQTLGMKSMAGKEDDLNEKEYVEWLWNWQYQWSAVSKELIRPKWRLIEMDGRKGVGTFARSVYKDGSFNYGYVAYVQGERQARNLKPDLLLYVMQDSRQAKGSPPMDKKKLEKMAEHIVSSIRRR